MFFYLSSHVYKQVLNVAEHGRIRIAQHSIRNKRRYNYDSLNWQDSSVSIQAYDLTL